jgi:hypothetical protein
MAKQFVYMPVFRYRTEEKKVLLSRDFGENIFPCVEIIKATPQKIREKKIKKLKPGEQSKKPKEFHEIHLPELGKIKAKKIFVDLPVHMKQPKRLKEEVLKFLRNVVDNRRIRTEHILQLAPLKDRIIPVISSYFDKTNEKGSIKLQEADLRKTFNTLAFRTFPSTIDRDLEQIEKVIQDTDYIIFDIGDSLADESDPDVLQTDLGELKEKVNCQIIIVRNIVTSSIKNNAILHGKVVAQISNDLIESYRKLYGTGFGDYAGIKKDDVTEGGGISPGFIFYDPVRGKYYGFRGDVYTIKGKKTGKLRDFEDIIIPDVIKSNAVKRMRSSGYPYLAANNMGWELINEINAGREKGQHQGKFKRISMEHYVHCIDTLITAGLI